jgi:hypothetical protein
MKSAHSAYITMIFIEIKEVKSFDGLHVVLRSETARDVTNGTHSSYSS